MRAPINTKLVCAPFHEAYKVELPLESKHSAGWDEDEHPRGKTSEKSTPGSFAPTRGKRSGPRLNEEFVNEAQSNLDKAMDDNELDEELRQQAKSRLEEAFKGARVAINRKSIESARDLLLGSGRMKSQFETGQSSGTLNPKLRAYAEWQMFGVDTDIGVEPDQRPIYGYLLGQGETPFYKYEESYRWDNVYGQIRYVLKDEAADRATWTETDSLFEPSNSMNSMPSAVREPRLYTLVQGSPSRSSLREHLLLNAPKSTTMQDLRNISENYIEAQVHGQVRKEDISEIHMPRSKWEQFDAPMRTEIKRLKIRVYTPDGQELST